MRGLSLRPATPADTDVLQQLRARAFAPVFASFRALLGDTLYARTQQPGDEQQPALLRQLIDGLPGWSLWVAELDGRGAAVGFVALRVDIATSVGEIGLNAVDPELTGRGIGTAIYRWALDRLRSAGMTAAVVGTGGDASHAAARRAYRKAGFEHAIPSLWLARRLDD